MFDLFLVRNIKTDQNYSKTQECGPPKTEKNRLISILS